jgi:hypothetical protein
MNRLWAVDCGLPADLFLYAFSLLPNSCFLALTTGGFRL